MEFWSLWVLTIERELPIHGMALEPKASLRLGTYVVRSNIEGLCRDGPVEVVASAVLPCC